MKNYYFVLEQQSKKVLGFNLTEEEKNKLFYHINTPSGHSNGRSYGALQFKVKNKKELNKILNLRKYFKNNNEYSYIIVTNNNEWVGIGYNETEKQVLDSIVEAKQNFPDANDFLIYEIIGVPMNV